MGVSFGVFLIIIVIVYFGKFKKIFSRISRIIEAKKEGKVDKQEFITMIIIFVSGLASLLVKLFQEMGGTQFYSVLLGFIPLIVFCVSLLIRYNKNAFDKIKKRQLFVDAIICVLFIVFSFV